nr:ribonuclease H-like domain-containing protein [Tanacetum cinerariifolium]
MVSEPGSETLIKKILTRRTLYSLKEMDLESTQNNVVAKLPLLKQGDYEIWNQYKDAKTLFEAIQARFGGNDAIKKTQKTLLKQMYEKFNAPSTKSLDSIFNRLQKIVSQLVILDLDTMSIGDLYNNFKIIEQEVKRTVTTSSSSGSQNIAFLSSSSSTNEVDTVNIQVSTVNTPVSTVSTHDNTANLSDATVYAFLANQPNGYFQRTSKNIIINGSDTAGYDKTNVECFNCHKMRLFARECRSPRNQERKQRNQDSSRKTVNVEDTSSKAMVTIDEADFDWSYMADDEAPTNMTLMAFSDSEGIGKGVYPMDFGRLSCENKGGKREFNKSEFDLATYKRGLASVEEQLVFYKKNEVMFCDQIAMLKRDASSRDSEINALNLQIEKLKKEKESNRIKINNFENASKSLDKLIGSQISDNTVKQVWGLQAIMLLHLHLQAYLHLQLLICPTLILRSSNTLNLKDMDLKTVSDSDDDESEVIVLKLENVQHKPEQANQPKKVSQNPRNNRTNWNEMRTRKLGVGFQFTKKACFVCGSFSHLIKDCDFHDKKVVQKPVLKNVEKETGQMEVRPVWNNTMRINHQNFSNYKKYFSPTAVLTKFGIVPISTARQSSSRAAAPVMMLGNMGLILLSPQHAGFEDLKLKYKIMSPKNSGSYICKRFDYVDPEGRLKNMTGNISYLTDFKEHDGGYVAFGGGDKGGKITGKGTIKTDVLFTDTECFVRSPNFKLADESHVLLKVPRKNNMYSFDMKKIVPQKDLTCLLSKATNDKSMLWHKRLGHINFKNINKLVKDNLVRGLPSKRFENGQTCVACSKGKQHKVSFKSKIQNSISQPLFMLHMDLFGPTSAEAVNTACYVQNRVLVVKPHFKTLYELFKDEGIFVGYSTLSKAFRVYHTRTRKVEENLHITFLENKPMIVGGRPEWLFDIDALLESMNYAPVPAGLQVDQRTDGIFLSEDKYVCDILKKFGFSSVKSASTPMETHKPLSKDANGTYVDVHLYRSMIGSLIYLTSSRPDIMFVVYVLWLQNQLLDYGYNFMQTNIHVDNESAICVVKNLVYHSKTKHIEIQYHFIRDSYEKILITMVRIHTDYNVSDLLTKSFDVTSSKTINSVKQIHAIVDGKAVVISESSMRSDLLFVDEDDTVPPTPHDSPLAGGYTCGSDDGRLKLLELMNTCTKLLNRVTTLQIDLSSTKVVYHKAFVTLAKRVKKLETRLKQKRSRTVIHSSDEEEPTKETARQEQERYNLEKALELQKQLDQRKEDVDKGDQTQDINWNDPEVLRYHALQNRVFSKAEVRKNMCTYLKNQGGEVMKRSRFNLQQESSKKQKLDEQTEEEVKAQADTDHEVEEMKLYVKIVLDEDLVIDVIPLATKPPVIVEYKIVKEGKISTYHIIRADESTKRYTLMIKLLENIDREDLETLWKLVKDKHGNTRPEEDYERCMSTRSTSSNLFSPLRDPESLIGRRNLSEPSSLFDFEEVMSIPHNNQGPPPAGPLPPQNNNGPPLVVRPNGPAPRSMEELCQLSINGRGRPIAPIPIPATDFGLRRHMIQQVQNSCQFYGLPSDDTNRHIDKFLEITQYIKQNGVSDDALRLSLFPYSLTHHATAWYDRLSRNSIHNFDDMMREFLLKYFSPSMVTKLRNEITEFRHNPNESLFEAWEHYKSSNDRCPNHNMLLVTQIDTFYNGLTLRHWDTINAAAGGTFMQKTPEECYDLIKSMTTHHNHWDTLATQDETFGTISSTTTTESPEVIRQLEMMNKNFQEMMKQMQSVKSVDTKCATCGGPHSYTECPAVGGYTQEAAYATTGNHNSGGNSYQPQGDRNLLSYRSNNYLGPPGFNRPNVQNNQNRYNQNQRYNQNRGNNFNQGNYQAPNNQVQVQPSNELSNYMKINETNMRAMQNLINTMRTKIKNDFETSMAKNQNELKNRMSSFLQMKQPSGSGSLPSNTIANSRGDVKAITTQSGVAYDV